jgi:hypothetical protein
LGSGCNFAESDQLFYLEQLNPRRVCSGIAIVVSDHCIRGSQIDTDQISRL